MSIKGTVICIFWNQLARHTCSQTQSLRDILIFTFKINILNRGLKEEKLWRRGRVGYTISALHPPWKETEEIVRDILKCSQIKLIIIIGIKVCSRSPFVYICSHTSHTLVNESVNWFYAVSIYFPQLPFFPHDRYKWKEQDKDKVTIIGPTLMWLQNIYWTFY